MLDQQDGQAGLPIERGEDRDHPVGLGRAQAGHHLVEQQEFWIGRDRARDLETLAVRQREGGGGLRALVEEIEPGQHVVRMPARGGDVGAPQERADDDVVLDRERRKRPHDLERASHTAPAHRVGRQPIDALAAEGDRSGVGRKHAGDHVEERGLAGAVGPDHRKDIARRDGKANPVDREQAAETLGESVGDQERRHGVFSPTPRRRASHGHTPAGRNEMMAISVSP